MKRTAVMLLALAWTVRLLSSQPGSCDARAVWERMVEAKGGRSKLEAVHSLLVTKRYSWWEFLVRRSIDSRTLYRFPDFMWSWFDNGTPLLGISVGQAHLDRDISLDVVGPSRNPKMTRGPALRPDHHPFEGIPVRLLETGWLKPILGSCTQQGDETVVEAKYQQLPWLYRFFTRRGSGLPYKVEIERARGVETHDLSEYQLTSGIWLPGRHQTKYGLGPAPAYRVNYIINPDYDRTLPDREPSLEAGPEAWRAPSARRPQE